VLENQVIGFKTGTTILTPESEAALDQVVAYLEQEPTLMCEVRGYDPQTRENRQLWILSLQRALATEDYLEIRGIAGSRLTAHVFHIGEGTEGRPTDRLVDLVVRARQ
jgi:outer membrane protein OmpA-like peptidoglycan-associated protein